MQNSNCKNWQCVTWLFDMQPLAIISIPGGTFRDLGDTADSYHRFSSPRAATIAHRTGWEILDNPQWSGAQCYTLVNLSICHAIKNDMIMYNHAIFSLTFEKVKNPHSWIRSITWCDLNSAILLTKASSNGSYTVSQSYSVSQTDKSNGSLSAGSVRGVIMGLYTLGLIDAGFTIGRNL